MKIQLDTTNKTIKIEENIKISKLIEMVKKLLPNDWKDFMLITNTTITYWTNPIIYKEYYPIKPYWEYPWYCSSSTTTLADKSNYALSLESGTFNIEL